MAPARNGGGLTLHGTVDRLASGVGLTMDTSQIVITLGVAFSVLSFFLRYAIRSMPWYVSWGGVVAGLFLALVALWPTHSMLAQESLPGFSSTFALKINDAATINRQYIFDYGAPEGSKVAFYFSNAGDRFVFLVTDVGGNTQSLDVPIGSGGIPFAKFIFLTNEVGLGTNNTYLRTLINGKEVQSRSLSFRMDLGSRRWTQGAIGADSRGKNSGAFEALALGAIGHVTLTDREIDSLIRRSTQFLKDTNSPIAKGL
jgi:hypothetical protein